MPAIMNDFRARIAEHAGAAQNASALQHARSFLKKCEGVNPQELRHLTPSGLKHFTDAPNNQIAMIVADILEQSGVLAKGYEFYDEEEIYGITVEDMKEAEAEGNMVHPRTGELVLAFRNHVAAYHYATDGFLEALKSEQAAHSIL